MKEIIHLTIAIPSILVGCVLVVLELKELGDHGLKIEEPSDDDLKSPFVVSWPGRLSIGIMLVTIGIILLLTMQHTSAS